MTDDFVSLMDSGVPLLKAGLPIAGSSSLVQLRQEGGSMNLGTNRGVSDCQSLIVGLMGGDTAGQYFARRQLAFNSLDDVDVDSATSPQVSEVHSEPED